jgi:hypothetical protein
MLRQEAALDRSIDRKVRILLALRKESTNLPLAPTGEDDGGRMENIEEALNSDIVSDDSQGVETVEDLKLREQCGNVIENKGPAFSRPRQYGNLTENKGSYAQEAGMSLKRKGVIENAELHATSKWPTFVRKPGKESAMLIGEPE